MVRDFSWYPTALMAELFTCLRSIFRRFGVFMRPFHSYFVANEPITRADPCGPQVIRYWYAVPGVSREAVHERPKFFCPSAASPVSSVLSKPNALTPTLQPF